MEDVFGSLMCCTIYITMSSNWMLKTLATTVSSVTYLASTQNSIGEYIFMGLNGLIYHWPNPVQIWFAAIVIYVVITRLVQIQLWCKRGVNISTTLFFALLVVVAILIIFTINVILLCTAMKL